MKLYATTTSERASKGQGGNKELWVEIFVGSRDKSQKLATIAVLPPDNKNPNGLLSYNIESLDGWDIEATGTMERRDTKVLNTLKSRSEE